MFLSISLNHPFSLLDEQGYVRAIAAKKIRMLLVPLYSLVVQTKSQGSTTHVGSVTNQKYVIAKFMVAMRIIVGRKISILISIIYVLILLVIREE